MKNITKILLILILANINLFAEFKNGDGSAQNPYEIWTLEDLIKVSDFPDKHFIQKANIRKPLTKPLCYDWKYPFTGSYNGNGFLINLNIVNTDTVYATRDALFALVMGNAVIKNVVTVGSVKGGHAAGIASGVMNNIFHAQDSGVRIINNINNAKIEGILNCAGIVAEWCSVGIIDNNINNGTVIGDSNAWVISGIIASMGGKNKFTISNNINNGTLIDNSNNNTSCCNAIHARGTSGILGLSHNGDIESVLFFNNVNNGVILMNGNAIPPRIKKGISNDY